MTGSLERVQTERLIGERLRGAHLDELDPLLRDDRVWPTLWARRTPPTRGDNALGLEHTTAHWQRHGFGLWLARDRMTAAAVGRGGLQYTRATGGEAVEVAWMIAPERWGQGLATELARCALDVGFTQLKLAEIVALTLPGNVASRRVMEKVGMRYERELEHAGLPHVLYRAAAAEGPSRTRV